MITITAGEIVYGNVKILLGIQIKYTEEKILASLYVLIEREQSKD